MDDISVLIIDDSALMRNLISRIITEVEGLTVAGKAMNGAFGLEKIAQCNPDVIVLDIEMPVMTGIEFLKERRKRNIHIPVIMMSSLTTEGAAITMECLDLGASDFITKPAAKSTGDLNSVASRLVEMLFSYGGQYARRQGKKVPFVRQDLNLAVMRKKAEESAASLRPPAQTLSSGSAAAAKQEQAVRPSAPVKLKPQFSTTSDTSAPVKITPLREGGRVEIIALGISTGGPNALREVFKNISPDIKQPILVVQHMPAGFTAEFARSLDSICPLEVREAQDGDLLKSGRVLIAPGNYHLYVERKSLASIARLSSAEPCNGHRPSVDVLFESVAKIYENRSLGVIMTGMGRDGAAGLAQMRKQGAHTLGQDEESSIVYGMPKVAYELGGVERQVPLSQMAQAISEVAKQFE